MSTSTITATPTHVRFGPTSAILFLAVMVVGLAIALALSLSSGGGSTARSQFANSGGSSPLLVCRPGTPC
jgi:hypothetical protein